MSAVEWEPPQRAVNPHTFCPRDRYGMCDCGTATDPELVEERVMELRRLAREHRHDKPVPPPRQESA